MPARKRIAEQKNGGNGEACQSGFPSGGARAWNNLSKKRPVNPQAFSFNKTDLSAFPRKGGPDIQWSRWAQRIRQNGKHMHGFRQPF